MKSVAFILNLLCSSYNIEFLDALADHLNQKANPPVVELSVNVLHKDLKDVCGRHPEQSIGWAVKIIHGVDRDNWKNDGHGTIYTPTGQDYRLPTG